MSGLPCVERVTLRQHPETFPTPSIKKVLWEWVGNTLVDPWPARGSAGHADTAAASTLNQPSDNNGFSKIYFSISVTRFVTCCKTRFCASKRSPLERRGHHLTVFDACEVRRIAMAAERSCRAYTAGFDGVRDRDGSPKGRDPVLRGSVRSTTAGPVGGPNPHPALPANPRHDTIPLRAGAQPPLGASRDGSSP